MCALPGNRTRVTRMGILYDTTTPAVLEKHNGMIEIKLRGETLAVETKTRAKRKTLTWKRNGGEGGGGDMGETNRVRKRGLERKNKDQEKDTDPMWKDFIRIPI